MPFLSNSASSLDISTELSNSKKDMEDHNNSLKIITENECIEVLHNTCDVNSTINIISFKLDPVSTEMSGMLGEYFHLTIHAEMTENQHIGKYEYFLKTLPVYGDEENLKFVENLKVFPKEVGLYTKLFKEMDKFHVSLKWYPKCYYARPDLLIMEDLTKLNYRHPRIDEFFSLKHLKITLQRVAAMHANSIIFEVNTGINISEKFGHLLEESTVTTESEWLHVGLLTTQSIAASMPKYQNAAAQKFISEEFMKCKNQMIKVGDTSNVYRNVVCHRDLWLKNILYKYDEANLFPVDCMLVDFQIARYCPPAADVMMFIYLNTGRTFRETHINDLLKFYYDCLSRELEMAKIEINHHITWKDFLKSCEYVRVLPLNLSSIFTQLAHLPQGFLTNFKLTDPEGYMRFVTINRDDVIFNQMKTHEKYRDRLLECCEEIMDYVMTMSVL